MLSDAGVEVMAPFPGDYNGNGVVDAADYNIWRDTLGSTTDLRANGDNSGASAGKIDQADYDLWKTNFGMHAGNGTGEGVASMVAEPSTAALLVIGCVVAVVVPVVRGTCRPVIGSRYRITRLSRSGYLTT
jgi:hypothetical protein